MSFLDFCLHCDTQTSGGAYCSQRCRLLDMDTSPTLTASTSSPASNRRGSSTSANSGTGFYLPPPFDFSAYRTSSSTTKSGARSTATSRPTSLYSLPGHGPSSIGTGGSSGPAGSFAPRRSAGLSPSSSRSSLPTFESSWGSMSRSTREELREYGNSFDTVRDLRRRITMA